MIYKQYWPLTDQTSYLNLYDEVYNFVMNFQGCPINENLKLDCISFLNSTKERVIKKFSLLDDDIGNLKLELKIEKNHIAIIFNRFTESLLYGKYIPDEIISKFSLEEYTSHIQSIKRDNIINYIIN